MEVPTTLPSPGRDHTRGPVDAPVILLEYMDYECPFCRAAYLEVESALQVAGSFTQFSCRNFPITSAHPHAFRAACAAESAAIQGKFWEMHGMLFKNQPNFDDELVKYAAALDLDMDKFIKDLISPETSAKVREDFMLGVRAGVNGTPTFFINGVRHDGGYFAEQLLAAIEAEAGAAV